MTITDRRISVRHPVTDAIVPVGVVVNPLVEFKSDDCCDYSLCLCYPIPADSIRWQSASAMPDVPAARAWAPGGAR